MRGGESEREAWKDELRHLLQKRFSAYEQGKVVVVDSLILNRVSAVLMITSFELKVRHLLDRLSFGKFQEKYDSDVFLK